MNIESFDLNLLVAFELLMTERSVTRTAARLGVTQPALSNALARLRTSFDDPLFVRTPKGMIPTPRAAELAPVIHEALKSIRGALAQSSFDPAHARGRFVVSCTDYVQVIHMTAVTRLMEKRAPLLEIAMVRAANIFDVPQEELETGAIDFAIGPFAQPFNPLSGLSAIPLAQDRLVCVSRANRPELKQKLTPEAFAALRHIAIYYPGRGPGSIDRLLAQRGLVRRVSVVVPHFTTALFVAAGSSAIATVPRRLAEAFSRVLPIQIFELPLPAPVLKISIAWHTRTEQEPAHIWFREVMAARFRPRRARRE